MPKSSGRNFGRPRTFVATDKQKKAIASMFAEERSVVKMAQHTGISAYHVRCVMHRQGLTLASRYPGGYRSAKVPETDKKAMATMYNQGLSQVQIAQRFKLSTPTVARALRLLGVQGRRGPKSKNRNTSAQKTMSLCNTAEHRQSPEIAERGSLGDTVHCTKRQDSNKDSWDETAAPFVQSFGTSEAEHPRLPERPAVHEKPSTAIKAETLASSEPTSVVINCHASDFRCDPCQFHSDMEEQFISHLLRPEHERMHKKGVLLMCAGCRFKTRQPMKVIGHAVKHRTLSAATPNQDSIIC